MSAYPLPTRTPSKSGVPISAIDRVATSNAAAKTAPSLRTYTMCPVGTCQARATSSMTNSISPVSNDTMPRSQPGQSRNSAASAPGIACAQRTLPGSATVSGGWLPSSAMIASMSDVSISYRILPSSSQSRPV